ncbi:uncharacterized protein [Ptychodera flava]|uniref:uncharacterized protein n=1 Tax=Ptychodera flava TaxID=63121 RepID=UPI00396A94A9
MNMVKNVPFYNLVVLCSVEEMKDIIEIMSGSQLLVEKGYYYVNTYPGSTVTMCNAVHGVLIGYWSVTGDVAMEQVNMPEKESHHNFWSCTADTKVRNDDGTVANETQKPIDLMEILIETFSSEDAMVLDACSGTGSTAVAVLRTGRDVFAIEKDADQYACLSSRILQTFSGEESQ